VTTTIEQMLTEPESSGLIAYTIDPVHSCVSFSIRHMMVTNIRGRFNRVEGSIRFHSSDYTMSAVEARIDVDSLHTGDAYRDGHLKGTDFFDLGANPYITFRSTRIVPTGKSTVVLVEGDLTICSITRPVFLEAEYAGASKHVMTGNHIAGFSARGTLDRKLWNLTWNAPLETGGLAIGDAVNIEIDIQAIRAS
jgi:polyisoprenoid-binding protein YceI